MSLIHNDVINKSIRIKFLFPLILLTVVCCLVIVVFSLLLLNKVQNNNTFILSEMLIILIILAACIFLTRYIISSLMKEVRDADETARTKSIFLAQMSHEIRTPMNVILGISEIQLLDKNLSVNAEEGFRKIYESGKLLLNIINDILDFSKIDAGKLKIVNAQYNIPDLINDVVQLNRLRFEHKPVLFKINLDENTPYELTGDEIRIKQILYNLLSNAFKYTEAGEVDFSIYAETENNDETTVLVFRVVDTGQGMTKNQISMIFDEYARFNLETNRSISGIGLGMSITKRLIDMMGGEIHAESKPGEGSVFTVRLPQARRGAAVCGCEAANNLREFNFSNAALKKNSQIIHEHMPYGKVLIVDDIESNLLVAKGLLMPYGLHIETVNSGFEAIEKIKNDKNYDIVFMDHMMPVMDGIKTTKTLRGMGYTHPIVALTANAVIGQEEMFLSNGFDGFISKPIDSRELNHILIELIRNKKLEKNNEGDTLVSDSSRLNLRANETIRKENLIAAAAADIKNAIAVLEEILPKINAYDVTNSGADIELYTITVHGMKSALANIGETRLSDIAYRLEKTAALQVTEHNGEITILLKETSEFIMNLKSFLKKIKSQEADDRCECSHDDMVFLQNKLNDIKTACGKLIPKDAKKALNELKQKTWPGRINSYLEEISLYLLRGEYSKAVSAAEKAATLYL